MNRLKKLKKRLDKTPHLLNEYDKIFDEYLKLGIIEEVQTQRDTGQVVYLPHEEVVKEDRSTTKLRIVFDASVKYKDTMPLNDVLDKGPCLNADLYSLSLKFRVYPIALTADIEKAYLQININEEHRVPKYVNIVNSFNNEKILGLYWDHQRDVISLKISEIFKEAVNIVPTKRNILSLIASV